MLILALIVFGMTITTGSAQCYGHSFNAVCDDLCHPSIQDLQPFVFVMTGPLLNWTCSMSDLQVSTEKLFLVICI